MLISIIIPLYNKEHCILNTLNSVINQTYTNIEIIIIDDGSTDGSVKVVENVKDDRIKLFRQTNHGVAYTRNQGAIKANGSYLIFLDADDLLKSNAIFNFINLINNHPGFDLYSLNFIIKKRDKEYVICKIEDSIINNPFKLIWEGKWNIRLGSFIINKIKFLDTGGFVSYISIGEDTYFTNNIIKQNNIYHSNQIGLEYILDSNNLSRKKFPFENHIENYFLQDNSDYYQQLNESFLIFKHFFRGFVRCDLSFSYKLTLKFYSKIPFIFKSLIVKLWSLKTIKS